MGSWKVVSRSARQTLNLGRKLGKLAQGGEIIGLIGELGAGKTCFVRGVADGADVGKEAWVRSPTFTLINEYQGRLPVIISIFIGSVIEQNSKDSICANIYTRTASA